MTVEAGVEGAPSPPGRVAVVTGASAGIGQAIAVALGELGWSVALGARRANRLLETARMVRDAGGKPFSHRVDISSPAEVADFYTTAEDTLGPIDTLINNAGVAWPGDVADVDVDRLREMVETNLLGTLLMTRVAVAALRARGDRGDIVFISSDAGVAPRPSLVPYAATKAALEALARGLALEVEGTGVRVTTVRPGPTATDFASGWGEPEEFASLVTRWRRFGIQRHWATLQPAHVAAAVVAAVTAAPGVRFDLLEVQPHPGAVP